MRVTILNYALPEPCQTSNGTRWWHKSGSRWPATISDRANDGTGYFPWPFLLAYLHSLLEKAGHSVVTVDACLMKLDLAQVVEMVAASEPEIVIFETSEQTEHSDPVILEQISSIAPVLLIGPNVQKDRLDLLNWPGVKAAVPGEYLISVADYLANPGVGMASQREVLGVEQMDALPFAYRDPDLFERYSARFKTTPEGPQGQFVSMWGCQYRCKFCIGIHAYWPNSSQIQKLFSLDRLEREVQGLVEAFPGVTSLYDDADNHFYRQRDDAIAYGDIMGRTGLPWAVLTRSDSYMLDGSVDRDLWRHWAENGCYAVKIGVEGGQRVADATNKRLDIENVREFVRTVQDLGIQVFASFMVNVPGMDKQSEQETLDLIQELNSYNPDLFEYFISSCDVTEVSPFRKDVETSNHDGQAQIERVIDDGKLDIMSLSQQPNNIEG